MINLHNFTRGSALNRPQMPLEQAEMSKIAPSIFASQPSAKTSDKYLFIPTSNFVSSMASLDYLPSKVSQSKSRLPDGSHYAKHMIRFRHKSLFTNQPTVGDSIPEITLVNSHDGASSFQLSYGLYRLACSNGLMVGKAVETQRISHQQYNRDNVIEASYRVLSGGERIAHVVPALQNISVSRVDQLALANAALTYRYPSPDQTKPTPERLLSIRRYEDSQPNLWNTFNTIQENLMKGGIRTVSVDPTTRRPRRNSTRAINSVTEEVRLNKILWDLTEHFASLKTNDSLFVKMDTAHA